MRLVGSSVRRMEDPRLITGRGQYIDDITLPGMLHAVFVRSRYAHARIKRLNAEKASRHQDAVAVIAGDEVARALKPLPKHGMQGMKEPELFPLAVDKVRYAGEPVALCVASSRYGAYDVAELVEAEYEPLKPLVDPEKAMAAPDAVLYGELGDNVSLRLEFKGGDLDAAFREADAVIRRRIRLNRSTGAPIETRGGIAEYNPASRTLTLWSNTQFPHVYRTFLARYFALPENRVRVIVRDVGGAFGVKVHLFREDVALCYAAMKLGRPVKWVEDRTEHSQSSIHEREQIHDVEVAVKRDGTLLGLRDRCIADLGAFGALPWGGGALSMFTSVLLPGPYKLKGFASEHVAVFTNKAPYGAVRGPALLQANYVVERVVDLVARELNLDPAEVRMKNLVKSSELPYTTLTGQTYNATSFDKTLERLLALLDYKAFREEQQRLRREGRYLGVGFSILVEYGAFSSAVASLFGMGGFDSVLVRVEPTGKVSVHSGLLNIGQGLETTLAQAVAEELQLSLEDVGVHMGDTASAPYGVGSHSSRGAIVGGSAAMMAAARVKAKMTKIAAAMLEAREEDVVYERRRFYVKGAPARAVTFEDVVNTAYVTAHKLPRGVEPGLEATSYYEPGAPITWANGAHAAVVEVDPETGRVWVLRYYVVEDCGNMINPTIVEGQIVGGVVQGIGNIVYEDLRYDEDGNLISPSFMDYLLPTAAESPSVRIEHLSTPAPDNPGGYKGVGEGGTIAAPAAVVNAVEDALSPFKAELADAPLQPHVVWSALRQKGQRAR